MALYHITIPESQQYVCEDALAKACEAALAKDGGDEQRISTKAHKEPTSFLESFSPWATSELISDAAIHTNNEEVFQRGGTSYTPRTIHTHTKACSALVEEVFHPQQAQQGEITNDSSFLPTLLSRVNFSMWSQSPSKNLSGEIQSLQGQQGAAAKLLDEIEKEADHINHRLKEKTQQAKTAKRQSNNVTGFFGVTCKTCATSRDSDELDIWTPRAVLDLDDTLELRPMLRNRIHERDVELRQLRHEIQFLRAEKAVMRQDETDAILDGRGNAKEALLKRYAAAFCASDGSQMKVTFLAWQQHVKQRALRKRVLKHSSLAFTSQSDQLKGLIFASWQTLVREKREAQKLKQERKRLSIVQSYAAKFAMQSDSSTKRSIFIGWWRVKAMMIRRKESSLRAAAQQKDGAATPLAPQKQGAAADKACCILM